MSFKVTPIKECQICYNTFEMNKIKNLKCWAEDNDHVICIECFSKESKRRKEIGIKNPNECILCKPFQEHVENITINSIDHITITYNSPYQNDMARPPTRDECINNCGVVIIIFFCLFMMSIM